jgi:anti-sigma factor RsiW
MKILSCASVRRRLDLWHDGELSPAEHCAVEQHLAGCPPCASDARALQQIGAVMRDLAARRALSGDEAAGMRSGVLARRKAEDAMSWTSQFGELFQDMHLVWAGLSATAATAICVVLLAGIAYLTPAERADSLSGMLNAMGTGPRASRTHADAVSAGFAAGVTEGDLVLALAAVVTQEGRMAHSGGLQTSRQDREAVLHLMDAVAAARFQSARPDGERLAVNVVWRDGPRLRLLQHMTVQGKATLS